METKIIDTDYTDKIKCPYCGNKNNNSWEYNNELQERSIITIECLHCGEEFKCEMYVEVTYSTSKIKEMQNDTI
jgi:transcription elongation factor Elf1